MMNRDQLCAVGKSSFHLHFGNHGGHSGHDLIATEKLASQIHQFGDDLPSRINSSNWVAIKRHGFGMIQAQAARQAFLRQKARLVKEQFVNFARRQVHSAQFVAEPFSRPRVILQNGATKPSG